MREHLGRDKNAPRASGTETKGTNSRASLGNSTISTGVPELAGQKDATYFTGVCGILDACGRNGVYEIHFADVHIFRTETGMALFDATREPSAVVAKIGQAEEQAERNMTEEKRALLEEIRNDHLENLDLTDPDEANEMLRKAALNQPVTGSHRGRRT